MAMKNKDLIVTVIGAVLIVGAGIADPYSAGVTVVGGVMTALGLKELLKL